MKWVELKMEQLGVLNNSNYKITALLDHMAMITVQSNTRGVFDCKPLGLIWAHFPEVCLFICSLVGLRVTDPYPFDPPTCNTIIKFKGNNKLQSCELARTGVQIFGWACTKVQADQETGSRAMITVNECMQYAHLNLVQSLCLFSQFFHVHIRIK